jgi:hypothetical protein
LSPVKNLFGRLFFVLTVQEHNLEFADTFLIRTLDELCSQCDRLAFELRAPVQEVFYFFIGKLS